MSLSVGDRAPDFTLPSDRGTDITLSAYRGKTSVLLAFYPGDFTPVCTQQMQCFATDWAQFRLLGCEILGISTDPLPKHQEFARKLGLEFPLLSDGDKTVVRLYGVNSLLGTRRAYFIVDREGDIRYKHIELLPVTKRDDAELLAVLRALP